MCRGRFRRDRHKSLPQRAPNNNASRNWTTGLQRTARAASAQATQTTLHPSPPRTNTNAANYDGLEGILDDTSFSNIAQDPGTAWARSPHLTDSIYGSTSAVHPDAGVPPATFTYGFSTVLGMPMGPYLGNATPDPAAAAASVDTVLETPMGPYLGNATPDPAAAAVSVVATLARQRLGPAPPISLSTTDSYFDASSNILPSAASNSLQWYDRWSCDVSSAAAYSFTDESQQQQNDPNECHQHQFQKQQQQQQQQQQSQQPQVHTFQAYDMTPQADCEPIVTDNTSTLEYSDFTNFEASMNTTDLLLVTNDSVSYVPRLDPMEDGEDWNNIQPNRTEPSNIDPRSLGVLNPSMLSFRPHLLRTETGYVNPQLITASPAAAAPPPPASGDMDGTMGGGHGRQDHVGHTGTAPLGSPRTHSHVPHAPRGGGRGRGYGSGRRRRGHGNGHKNGNRNANGNGTGTGTGNGPEQNRMPGQGQGLQRGDGAGVRKRQLNWIRNETACWFSYAGCELVKTASLNELVRHIRTLHFPTSFWVCVACLRRSLRAQLLSALDAEPLLFRPFNRRELYEDHCRSMHSCLGAARGDYRHACDMAKAEGREAPALPPAIVTENNRIHAHADDGLVSMDHSAAAGGLTYIPCAVSGCEHVSRGANTIDDHSRHLARHYQDAARQRAIAVTTTPAELSEQTLVPPLDMAVEERYVIPYALRLGSLRRRSDGQPGYELVDVRVFLEDWVRRAWNDGTPGLETLRVVVTRELEI